MRQVYIDDDGAVQILAATRTDACGCPVILATLPDNYITTHVLGVCRRMKVVISPTTGAPE